MLSNFHIISILPEKKKKNISLHLNEQFYQNTYQQYDYHKIIISNKSTILLNVHLNEQFYQNTD